ncbi:MAG: YfbR-like 5'-deoxynucleotidase [Candidatus Puniceispirillaceae bacterium]
MSGRAIKSTSKSHSTVPRAFQRMLSGRRLDILNPSPLDIEIDDIAHGLARVSRWNGQTSGKYAYSVAQHSILVEQLMHRNAPKLELRWRLACLLHDASEYVIGDMITPFKAVLADNYKQVEARLTEAVHLRFGLPPILPDHIQQSIKRADKMAAWLEATELAGFTPFEASKLFPKPRGTKDAAALIDLTPLSPNKASQAFLHRFKLLGGS